MKLSDTRHLIPDTLASERDRLVLWIPIWLGTGMGVYFGLAEEPSLWWGALALLVAVGGTFALRRHFLPRLLMLAFALMALGMVVAGVRTQLIATPVIYGELFFRTVEGSIDDIQEKENGRKLILREAAIERFPEHRTPKRLSVTLKKDNPELEIGDRVQLKAMLFAPPSPAMPGSYDFTRALFFNQIGAVGFSPSVPVLLEKGEPSRFNEWLNALRHKIADRIAVPMTPENAPVASAMMVGEQTAVSTEIADAMRDAGIYHVLSISGLHMSLAAGLLYFTFRLLLSLYPPLALHLPVKKIAASLGLLGAFAYLLLAGYPVPAVRSFVMVACVMLAVLFDRRGISLYSLAWAATIILLWQPESIFGASFQLSFAATLAILALYERFSARLFDTNARLLTRIQLYFFGLMATSLAATLATTPLVIYHFNRFTLWGIAANMLIVPLASFWIMPAAVLAFFAMPFGLEHWPLVWLDAGISLMVEGSRWFAGFPQAAYALPSPTFWGLLLTIFGGVWLCLWQKKWRLLGIPLILIGMSTITLHKPFDLLISDDATKIAMRRADGNYLFIRGTPESFDGKAWLRALGKEDALTLSDVTDGPACDKDKCRFTLHGKTIEVGLSKKRTDTLCREPSDIVISDGFLSSEACAGIPHLFDKKFLERNGATALRFEGTAMKIDTADEHRGVRPWVSRRPPAKAP